ncbi:hypothetical protein [Mangrovibacterium lignilyticum]|uniref:hypothetical protein n=1 Tax=Mangrovibacterium lignilyticum TaxID=2668052 RepID=UPI0013D89ECF|nr:hypothetical protein [Mangrovibacterium lignilyticum]
MERLKRTKLNIVIFGISWLVFPPLFLYLSIKWKKPKIFGRIILTIFAPISLILLMTTTVYGYSYYYHYIKRGSRAEIEESTGIDFPGFKTIKERQLQGSIGFNGDFNMTRTVQIDTAYIDGILNAINNTQLNDSVPPNVFKGWDTRSTDKISFHYLDKQDYIDFTIERETGLMDIKFGSY